ncbi:MAG: precorrin-3B C(17)-methyltransferase [Hyphomicrobiales bacterium]|nr:precorrin-3B C(17)-methyltransferase [Hyphomicrobiales bacterium]
MTETPVFVALTAKGAALAYRLRAGLPGSEVHVMEGRSAEGDRTFANAIDHIRALFRGGHPILGVCATGILIRAVGPLVEDKHTEPPVVALAEDGGVVVPLLGGHRGANRLAEKIARVLKVEPAITTSSERRFGVTLDDPPAGWRLANPEDIKPFLAALLHGEGVSLDGEAEWLEGSGLPFDIDADRTIRITERNVEGSERAVIYHPAVLALGVGCERGTEPEELVTLVRAGLADAGLAEAAVAGVYSIDLKADELAVHAVAAALGVEARFFSAPVLEAEAPRLANPSDLVFRAVGCHGVAEGAALAAAGPNGTLVVAKIRSSRGTCAVALAPEPIGDVGRLRGHLSVVGLGPGDPAWRTPEVEQTVSSATDLVGYRLYLDLLGQLAEGKTLHSFDLGEEEVRARAALDLAAEGRHVALVCSGDPGIYAMAALVFELLERERHAEWMRIVIDVAPGISALQAAAARIGAPLGHDFCAISLSDLLTPWTVIERRLVAAAAGDFVVALYNPVSRRRKRQFAAAVEILAAERQPDTPVVLARSLGRPGEQISVVDLKDLTPGQVDMLTVVLIGSSETRRVARTDGGCWVYTPRGYAAKLAGPARVSA